MSSEQSSGPIPIAICGPSGVGKGTLIKMLMDKYPTVFGFSVSNTTRAARPGEIDGVHYNFLTMDVFERAVENGEFIEYARVHANMYGTTYAGVDKVRSAGKICILDIDVQGVQKVKQSPMECKYLFVFPPSMEELEHRLRARGTETEEKIAIRLSNAVGELEYGRGDGNFETSIVNTDVEVAFLELESILKSWYPGLL